MDFNVKKLVGDAGTLFTRAVQVNYYASDAYNHLLSQLIKFGISVHRRKVGDI